MQEFLDNLDLKAEGLWFPVAVSILLAITVLLLPKKNITWREIYITFGIVGFATWISDAFIARIVDLLDLGNPSKIGIGEILCYTFVPTSLAVLYLNYLTEENRWKLTIFFSLLSVLVETGMVYFGYMKYTGWNLVFSIIVFIIAFSFLLPLHIKIVRK